MNDIVARAGALGESTLPKGMVELKSGEPGPSLFLVPGLGGRVDGFEMFGALLETPMPVIAMAATLPTRANGRFASTSQLFARQLKDMNRIMTMRASASPEYSSN